MTKVTIDAGVVIKSGYADHQTEVEKAQALQRISSRNAFLAPRVLGSSKANASISFEYLPDLESIRTRYIDACRGAIPVAPVESLFVLAGASLARIHAELRLAKVVEWHPSRGFESNLRVEGCFGGLILPEIASPAVLHGDYGFANVFVTGSHEPRLVILDPSPNGFTTFLPNESGPRGIDIANMLACIQGLVPLRVYAFLNWSTAARLAEAFLRGYEDGAGCHLPRKPLYAIARATARTYLQYRCRWNWQMMSANRIFFWSRKRELLHGE